jgi:hypothetical protein
MNGHVRLLETGDSSDSLPPSQSTEGSSISTASKLNSNSNSNSTLQDAEGEIDGDEVEEGEKSAEDKEKFTASHYNVSKTKFIKYTGEDDEEEGEEKFDQEKVLAEITSTVEAEEETKEVRERESSGIQLNFVVFLVPGTPRRFAAAC